MPPPRAAPCNPHVPPHATCSSPLLQAADRVLLAAASGDARHEGGAGPGAPEPPWPAALRTSFRSLRASVQLGARYAPPGATAGAPPAEAPLVS